MTVRLMKNAPLAPYTWLRVGGPADRLYLPNSEEDLAGILRELPDKEPLTIVGVGSNLIVRDGGIEGTVIRLGPGFGKVSVDGSKVTAGAAALDAKVAKEAAKAGLAGLTFYVGIPGTIGGAMKMNAGAYGGETKDHFVSGRAIDRKGRIVTLTAEDMNFRYRHSDVPDDLVLIEATYEARKGIAEEELAKIDEIMAKREATQPIREKTGGSTFKNPDPGVSGGRSAWQSVDAVGGRGRVVGDAMMSELHANFMINRGKATAADLESLGESIRSDVRAQLGYELEWEIKRLGRPA
ncbi:UDP-N-acetylmuramate dehydrogenase [Parvularcula lutaonensis]|uniref:UDP-N-acetylenolpyruvoylglucosamine reductase n=1 Tax=Parvularcula lutaonensis TaxID=491923 RepID=A0ABV7M789_9PROT|nr:UDP-N-acetylmuramate dehydrogenase [Parvularcula lutaonensis]GGY41600.1 UDP-N-acetylenolpyruvoylglucosamine reductase [Parvularcula lutaonensis]